MRVMIDLAEIQNMKYPVQSEWYRVVSELCDEIERLRDSGSYGNMSDLIDDNARLEIANDALHAEVERLRAYRDDAARIIARYPYPEDDSI